MRQKRNFPDEGHPPFDTVSCPCVCVWCVVYSELFEKEFRDSKRYSFPQSGSTQTPAHPMNDFEFKDYCRPIFAQLREWFGVKVFIYCHVVST